jgi:type 1 glutamine amidotransferase
MKKQLVLIPFLAFLLTYPGELSGQASMRLLIYSKNGEGYVHENIAAGIECLQKICRDMAVECDIIDNPAVFTEQNLQQYHAVIFNNTNNDVFDTDYQRLAFMRYIQAGGGFVGIHSATGTERNWLWFKQMIGATFLRHPPFEKYTLRKFDRSHQANAGLPDVWEKEDECYFFKEMNPGIHVLWIADLSTVNDSLAPDIFGNQYPAAWCNEFDGGRQWYTALGHDPSDYADPVYVQHLKSGIEWVLSRKIRIDFSNATATSIR